MILYDIYCGIISSRIHCNSNFSHAKGAGMSVRDSSCSWKRSWSTCLVVLASFPYGPMVACHTCPEFLEAMSQNGIVGVFGSRVTPKFTLAYHCRLYDICLKS